MRRISQRSFPLNMSRFCIPGLSCCPGLMRGCMMRVSAFFIFIFFVLPPPLFRSIFVLVNESHTRFKLSPKIYTYSKRTECQKHPCLSPLSETSDQCLYEACWPKSLNSPFFHRTMVSTLLQPRFRIPSHLI